MSVLPAGPYSSPVEPLCRPPLVIATRGASAKAPAGSMEAFRLALRLGATALEADLWRTADGRAVLGGDRRSRSGLRRRTVADVPRSALADVPTPADLHTELGDSFELLLAVRDPEAVDDAVASARAAGDGSAGRLWLAHADLDVLTEWRERFGDVRLVNATRLRDLRHGPERRAAQLAAASVDAVYLHHTDWTGGLTTLFHRFERLAFAWDAQHERIIANLVRMGVDGISGDHVDRLVDGVARPASG